MVIPPSQTHHDNATVRHLLQVGLDLLAVKGYNGTSISDITTTAGVPKGSFYYYFESKEVFCMAVMDAYAEIRIALFEKRMAMTEYSPLNRIKLHWFDVLSEFLSCDYKKGCLFGTLGEEIAAESPAFRQKMSEIYQNWLTLNAEAFRQAQKAGELPPELDVAKLAHHIKMMFKGALWEAKITHELAGFEYLSWLLFEHYGTPQGEAPPEVRGAFPWGLSVSSSASR